MYTDRDICGQIGEYTAILSQLVGTPSNLYLVRGRGPRTSYYRRAEDEGGPRISQMAANLGKKKYSAVQ